MIDNIKKNLKNMQQKLFYDNNKKSKNKNSQEANGIIIVEPEPIQPVLVVPISEQEKSSPSSLIKLNFANEQELIFDDEIMIEEEDEEQGKVINVEVEQEPDENITGNEATVNQSDDVRVNILLEEIELLKIQNIELIEKEKNRTERLKKEIIELKKFSGLNLMKEILKPIDLMERIVSQSNDNDNFKKYLLGFEMIIKQINQILEANGIIKIKADIGDLFDHNVHDANEQVEQVGAEPNCIVEVISSGYKMHDRVMIHALVKVAK